MKKLLILLLTLFLLTTIGCRTTKVDYKIVLQPKPQRQELKSPETLKDYAEILNYYEHLVQEYEVWADTITKMIEEPSK